MAIQFNLNALSRFSNVNFGDNDAIANLDGGDAFSFQADELSVTISSLSKLGQKKKRMKPFSR